MNFSKTWWEFVKVGGNNNFRETGGECTEAGKIGGNSKIGRKIQNLWSMTKEKVIRNFGG